MLAAALAGGALAAGLASLVSPASASSTYAAYVANLNSTYVTPLDLATGSPGVPITTTAGASAIAITPVGDGESAYVTNATADTVTPINLSTNQAGTPISVGNYPDAIAISPNGQIAYVANAYSDTVTPINLSTNTPEQPITVGTYPIAVAFSPSGQYAYVANINGDSVTPIDLSTNTAGPAIAVGADAAGIAVAPNSVTVEVVTDNPGLVVPIDSATNVAGPPISISSQAHGDPRGIAFSSDGSTAYVTNASLGTVTPVDLETATAGVAIPVGSSPAAIATTLVDPSPPAITNVPNPAIYGESGFAASVQTTGDGVVSLASTTPTICSVTNGFDVAYLGAGTCTLVPSVTAGLNDAGAVGAPKSFPILPASQSIIFSSAAPVNPTVGSSYVISATGGGSGNPVTFSLDGTSNASACAVVNSVVAFTGTGLCVVDANQAGDSDYAAAPPAVEEFSVVASSVPTTTIPAIPSSVTTPTSVPTPSSPTTPGSTTTTTVATATTTPASTTTTVATATTTASSSAPDISTATATTTTTTTVPTAISSASPDVTTTTIPGTTTTTVPEPVPVDPTPVVSTPTTQQVPSAATGVAAQPAPADDVAIAIDAQPGVSLADGKVAVSGTDFLPGSRVIVYAHSTPIRLGSARVNARGRFSVDLPLPAKLPTGAHHIVVIGTLNNGADVTTAAPFTVASGDVVGTVGSIPPGPLADDVAFVPTSHPGNVLVTTAGATVAIGAVGTALGGGFSSGGGGRAGGGASGATGGGYLEDVELEREDLEVEGRSRGDRSRTWQWPGTGRLDHLSKVGPSRGDLSGGRQGRRRR